MSNDKLPPNQAQSDFPEEASLPQLVNETQQQTSASDIELPTEATMSQISTQTRPDPTHLMPQTLCQSAQPRTAAPENLQQTKVSEPRVSTQAKSSPTQFKPQTLYHSAQPRTVASENPQLTKASKCQISTQMTPSIQSLPQTLTQPKTPDARLMKPFASNKSQQNVVKEGQLVWSTQSLSEASKPLKTYVITTPRREKSPRKLKTSSTQTRLPLTKTRSSSTQTVKQLLSEASAPLKSYVIVTTPRKAKAPPQTRTSSTQTRLSSIQTRSSSTQTGSSLTHNGSSLTQIRISTIQARTSLIGQPKSRLAQLFSEFDAGIYDDINHADTEQQNKRVCGQQCEDIIDKTVSSELRYVCVECADYDLCGACELQAHHAARYVIGIPSHRDQAEIDRVMKAVGEAIRAAKHASIHEQEYQPLSVDEEEISAIKNEDDRDPDVVELDPLMPMSPSPVNCLEKGYTSLDPKLALPNKTKHLSSNPESNAVTLTSTRSNSKQLSDCESSKLSNTKFTSPENRKTVRHRQYRIVEMKKKGKTLEVLRQWRILLRGKRSEGDSKQSVKNGTSNEISVLQHETTLQCNVTAGPIDSDVPKAPLPVNCSEDVLLYNPQTDFSGDTSLDPDLALPYITKPGSSNPEPNAVTLKSTQSNNKQLSDCESSKSSKTTLTSLANRKIARQRHLRNLRNKQIDRMLGALSAYRAKPSRELPRGKRSKGDSKQSPKTRKAIQMPVRCYTGGACPKDSARSHIAKSKYKQKNS